MSLPLALAGPGTLSPLREQHRWKLMSRHLPPQAFSNSPGQAGGRGDGAPPGRVVGEHVSPARTRWHRWRGANLERDRVHIVRYTRCSRCSRGFPAHRRRGVFATPSCRPPGWARRSARGHPACPASERSTGDNHIVARFASALAQRTGREVEVRAGAARPRHSSRQALRRSGDRPGAR